MNPTETMSKGLRRSAWFFYALIVLEILYMISPFALYYYSLYQIPLKWLQGHGATAFLTKTVLPHFAHTDSVLVDLLLGVSWPLMILGLGLFLWAFGQIYGSKLLRRGAVQGGLYRHIRHPQYLALAILGLGTSLYWSRFLVIFMYATMLFLYYALARSEEAICIRKFGSAYEAYRLQTGMFMPRGLEQRLKSLLPALPRSGWSRRLLLLTGYLAVMGLLTGLGFGLRNHALSWVTLTSGPDRVTVSLSPMTASRLAEITHRIMENPEVKPRLSRPGRQKWLVYVLPDGWEIPELGIMNAGARFNYLGSTGGHGNQSLREARGLRVLITRAVLRNEATQGLSILKDAVGIEPLLEGVLDPEGGDLRDLLVRTDAGKWAGIPVPLY